VPNFDATGQVTGFEQCVSSQNVLCQVGGASIGDSCQCEGVRLPACVCEAQAAGSTDVLSAVCDGYTAVCGDGILDEDAGEECDNGSANAPGASCTDTCTVTPLCGNFVVESGEECDAGTQNGDPDEDCLDSCDLRCGRCPASDDINILVFDGCQPAAGVQGGFCESGLCSYFGQDGITTITCPIDASSACSQLSENDPCLCSFPVDSNVCVCAADRLLINSLVAETCIPLTGARKRGAPTGHVGNATLVAQKPAVTQRSAQESPRPSAASSAILGKPAVVLATFALLSQSCGALFT